ncbi:MAG TPA: hypothetical protein PLM91_05750 [Bacillota bacterium]|nr:hypothetical protein [Bacillota bacterium]HOK70448.1 hypothetical protein [Bacillota bacterium]HOL51691.1 hypothetical protein [Bacillota bacterium]HPQ01683.1 hypothetical protein [Bacillota bacterium]HQD79747.1 hypothetical protein [Bacillota bacterium]
MRFVEPVEILEPGTGFVFHSISYGEHGYDSMDISSMRTADTAFEINSIPEVQFGGYASDTSHLPDRSGFWPSTSTAMSYPPATACILEQALIQKD